MMIAWCEWMHKQYDCFISYLILPYEKNLHGHTATISATLANGPGYIRRTTVNQGSQLIVNAGASLNIANDGTAEGKMLLEKRTGANAQQTLVNVASLPAGNSLLRFSNGKEQTVIPFTKL